MVLVWLQMKLYMQIKGSAKQLHNSGPSSIQGRALITWKRQGSLMHNFIWALTLVLENDYDIQRCFQWTCILISSSVSGIISANLGDINPETKGSSNAGSCRTGIGAGVGWKESTRHCIALGREWVKRQDFYVMGNIVTSQIAFLQNENSLKFPMERKYSVKMCHSTNRRHSNP